MSEPAVNLHRVAEDLGLVTSGMTAYLNTETGEVTFITDEEMRSLPEERPEEEDLEGLHEWEQTAMVENWEILNSPQWIALPTQYEINEYEMMKDFCYAVEDDAIGEDLLRQIQGSGAFQRFKNAIHRYGLADAWYAFRDRAYVAKMRNWLEHRDIPYSERAPGESPSGAPGESPPEAGEAPPAEEPEDEVTVAEAGSVGTQRGAAGSEGAITGDTVTMGELKIHYLAAGSGPTLLIFPAHLHAARGYEREIAYFTDRFNVVAFDYPGTGESGREMPYADERRFDPWGWWSDIACHLLLELEIDRAYVLGVGGGARAALHFAGHHARLHELTTDGLIADSFLADLDARTLHRALDKREHYYTRYSRLLEKEHGDDWREVVDAETAYLRRIADRGGYAVHDVVMNSIMCPVLLTGHMKDPLTPGIAREYARLAGIIPDCSIHLASAAGHPYIEYPWMWSNPEAFRAVADRFLASLT